MVFRERVKSMWWGRSNTCWNKSFWKNTGKTKKNLIIKNRLLGDGQWNNWEEIVLPVEGNKKNDKEKNLIAMAKLSS